MESHLDGGGGEDFRAGASSMGGVSMGGRFFLPICIHYLVHEIPNTIYSRYSRVYAGFIFGATGAIRTNAETSVSAFVATRKRAFPRFAQRGNARSFAGLI